MTPKPRTLDDYMDGEYKDENTGDETVNPDLLARTHMYVIPDDLRGGKVYKRNIKNRERWSLITTAFWAAAVIIVVFVMKRAR